MIRLLQVLTGPNHGIKGANVLWQVTSVSFSSCETFFQASCSGNCTFIWDTRMMPLKTGSRCVAQPPPLAQGKSFRALHRLSHGNPLPTADNSYQLTGYIKLLPPCYVHFSFHELGSLFLALINVGYSERGSCCSYVDKGDQGVNDARWFHNEAILVTASGSGRWATWISSCE